MQEGDSHFLPANSGQTWPYDWLRRDGSRERLGVRVALYRLEAWDTNKSRHFATRAISTKAKAQWNWTYSQGLAVFRT